MRVERTVGGLCLRRRSAIDGQIVRRDDPVVLIDLTRLLKVVACKCVPELADRPGSVEPALRRAVRARRRRKVEMIVLRWPQRNEIHCTAEGIAALQIGRTKSLRDVHAVEGRHGELREIDVAGVSIIELLTIEGHHCFRRVRSTQRNDGRRRRSPGVGMLDNDRGHLLERFKHLRVSKRIHLRARNVHLRNDVAVEREAAVDGDFSNRTQLGSIAWLEHDVESRTVAYLSGVHRHGDVPARDHRQHVPPGRHFDREVPFCVGRSR